MILTYDAIDAQGKRTTDHVDATNVAEAVEQLRGRGLFVTQIAQERQAKSVAAPARFARGAGRIPIGPLALVTRQLAMMLRSGSGIVPSVRAIQRQLKKPHQAELLGKIATDLEEGATLTDALQKHPTTFDPVYCAIVAAGEASGNLTDMFDRLASIVGKRRAVRGRVLGALAYPALLICMSMGIMSSLLFFVLPRFKDMFEQLQVKTPPMTQLLLTTGDLVRTYWYVGLIGLVLLVSLSLWLVLSMWGRRWLADVQTSIPVFGRLRIRLIQAQVLRTMGMLLESRVSVLEALELVRRSTTNKRFAKLFAGLDSAVTGGGRLSTAFEESGMIEPYVCQAIKTGEDSGNIGGAMTYCADVLDESNEELIKVVTRLIEPLILIGLGGVVGTVAISLFMPLFDLTSAMQ